MPVLQPRGDKSPRFGLFPFRSPLLRKSLLLSFPGGNEMFQFPPFATYAYGFSARQFGHPGLNARLTAPPGFSQSSTPFFAFWRLDIPHTPLVAWPHCSRSPPVPVCTGTFMRGKNMLPLPSPQKVSRGLSIRSFSKGSCRSKNHNPSACAFEIAIPKMQLLSLPNCQRSNRCRENSVSRKLHRLAALLSSFEAFFGPSLQQCIHSTGLPPAVHPVSEAYGGDGARTRNLRLAKPALSQLSYTPDISWNRDPMWTHVDSNHGPRPYQGRALTN